ncbi:MAG: DUF86 domain-containing protein [Chloroflexota bacterium]|nr:MAG: DUF86 domain-containing protein [Chloroflexota bacterium]
MRSGREYADYLGDIAEYAYRAEMLVAGTDPTDFQADSTVSLAVVRCLEIIGEAARHIPAHVRHRYSDVPWHKVVAMRNLLAHEYFGIDLEVIWRTVKEDLPALREVVSRMIGALDATRESE